MNTKNRFAAAGVDDSDDDVQQRMTKTAVKKEERKITERKPKVNVKALEGEGFEVVANENERGAEQPRRGGRGAARPETAKRGRGGRGGARAVREDADGNKVGAGSNQRERRPFTGKPREEDHPMDRQSGFGRGIRPNYKKGGFGKGNIGLSDDVAYKKKGEVEPEAATEEKPAVEEEKKVEEPPKVQYKVEVIGVSIDDFLNTRQRKEKAQGREAEGFKEKNAQQATEQKVTQATLQQNQYLKGTVAKTSDVETAKLTGFGSIVDDEDTGRGGRGGRGRGGRGGAQADNAQRGGRRQNPKQSLKKTEEDFPTL